MTNKIFISAGHYPGATGATNKNLGLIEHEENIKVVSEIFSQIYGDQRYIRVPVDTLHRKVDFVKRQKIGDDDIIVEVHFNACKSHTGRGIESLYHSHSEDDKDLASCIQKSLVKSIPMPDRGIKARENLYLLKYTSVPAIISECLFIDNDQDARFLLYPRAHEVIARAIISGIDRYFG